MLLQLSDGTCLELAEQDAALSEFLKNILDELTPASRLRAFLKKKKNRLFVATLEKSEVEYLSHSESLHDLGSLRVFIDKWLLVRGVALMCENADFPDLQASFDTVFGDAPRRLTFIKDDHSLKLIVKFLQIPNPDKSRSMFNELADIERTAGLKAQLPCWDAYEEFINACNTDELRLLAQYACALGIDPLIHLVGWKLAQFLVSTSEYELRKMFHVPADFRSASIEMVEKYNPVVTAQNWMTESTESK